MENFESLEILFIVSLTILFEENLRAEFCTASFRLETRSSRMFQCLDYAYSRIINEILKRFVHELIEQDYQNFVELSALIVEAR